MPTNKTWACFSCRRTARGAEWRQPTCPSCRQPMRDLGKRFPTPKDSAKAWHEAETTLNRIERANREYYTDEGYRVRQAQKIGRASNQ